MAGIPCILTIRRTVDGGTYYEGNILKTDETENYKYNKTKFDSLTPSESVIYNAQNFDFGAGTEIDLTKN